MKIVFAYEPIKNIPCAVETKISLGEAEVVFVSKNETIESANICFRDVGIEKFENDFTGVENEYKRKAFKIATYIFNRIFLEHGTDVFHQPRTILNKSPAYEPETEEEKMRWSRLKKNASAVIGFSWCGIKEINPLNYVRGYVCSLAYSYYADALRVHDPFIKYRLFFDVLQTYYDSARGDEFDQLVSADIKNSSNNYDSVFIENLRQIRNRIEHHNRGDNLNIENYDDIILVNENMENMKKVALAVINFQEAHSHSAQSAT